MQSLLVIRKSPELHNAWEGCLKSPVFNASFLRFLHCGRYPWLWNDEHALVMPTVVGIGLLFCVLAMG